MHVVQDGFAPKMTPDFVYKYLNQSEYWYPDGMPKLLITEMSQQWRANAARWLERNAKRFIDIYRVGEFESLANPRDIFGLSEMPNDVFDSYLDSISEAETDPVAWMKETCLHRALMGCNDNEE